MINLGLKDAEFQDLCRLLVSPHTILIKLDLMDLEGNHLDDLSKFLLSGQVTLDSDAEESTRQLSCELLDPFFKLRLDAEAPEDGSLYINKMIRVYYVVISPSGDRSYSIPIFTGPLDKVSRTGGVVSVEALNKETLYSSAFWVSKTFKKGLKINTIINTILTEIAGEKDFNLAPSDKKLPKKLTLNKEMTPWKLIRDVLAKRLGRQAFNDGRGVLQVRDLPDKVAYTFTDADTILSEPVVGFDLDGLVNACKVTGGKKKGAKKKIIEKYVAPRDHPLSPWKLGRNGVPRFLPVFVDDDSLKTKNDVKKLAKKTVEESLLQSLDVAFDSLPIPFLEENDLCRISTDQYAGNFRLKKMTIPLTANGKSGIGYIKRITPDAKVTKIKTARKRRSR